MLLFFSLVKSRTFGRLRISFNNKGKKIKVFRVIIAFPSNIRHYTCMYVLLVRSSLIISRIKCAPKSKREDVKVSRNFLRRFLSTVFFFCFICTYYVLLFLFLFCKRCTKKSTREQESSIFISLYTYIYI